MTSFAADRSQVSAVARRGEFSRWLAIWAALTLGSLALFFGASEWLIRTRVDTIDNLTRHVAYFRDATSPDAVFGDSMPAFGFTGQPDFVNLAFPAESISIVDTKIHAYFVRKTPGRVILQADPIQLMARRGEEDDGTRQRKRAYTAAFPLRVFSAVHRSRLIGYWRVWLSTGFPPSPFLMEPDGSLVRRVQDYEGPRLSHAEWIKLAEEVTPMPVDLARDADRHYRDAIEFIERKGGRVCLVSFPMLKAFREAAAELPLYAAAYAYFDRLAAETGATRLNLSAMFDDEKWFFDEKHVNLAAAKMVAAEAVNKCFPK